MPFFFLDKKNRKGKGVNTILQRRRKRRRKRTTFFGNGKYFLVCREEKEKEENFWNRKIRSFEGEEKQ